MRQREEETEFVALPGVALFPLDITDRHPDRERCHTGRDGWRCRCRLQQRRLRDVGPAGGSDGRTNPSHGQHESARTIRTTKAFILYLRQRKEGLFINTTSIGGLFTVTFNSVYHATKWALEGWSESMAFELNQLGIGMKIVEPGGMRTDCFTRSLDVGRHPAYDALLDSVMGAITDPKQMETFSTPDQVAEVVDEAATDGKDQLRYVAGTDAKAIYATRLQLGDEAFRGAIGQQFFGRQATIIGP
jgi:short chain dehydrogenase